MQHLFHFFKSKLLFGGEQMKTVLQTSSLVCLSMTTGDVLCQYLDHVHKTMTTTAPQPQSSAASSITVGEIASKNSDRHQPSQYEQNGEELSTQGQKQTAGDTRSFSHFLNHVWDRKRTLVMSTTGFFVSGPLGFTVFTALDHYIPGQTSKASLKKTLINACISPFTMCITFTTVTLLKGKSWSDARDKIAADLVPTYVASIGYWPIIGFCNFRFVPLQYRPVVGSIAGVIWNVYMAGQTNREVATSSTTTTPTAKADNNSSSTSDSQTILLDSLQGDESSTSTTTVVGSQ